jgi:RNA polymerase sigma-70 factor, ECF subfamily
MMSGSMPDAAAGAVAGREPNRSPPSAAAGDDGFHDVLVAALPRLRAHALALTRNRAAADDLVQDAVALALRGRDKFEPGTNFAAWSHSIVRNRFISLARRRRKQLEGDDAVRHAATDAAGPPHDDRLAVKELARMLGRLPAALREALLLVAVQGLSYDEVAAVQGCAVGTAKSRVFRARHLLRVWLLGGSAATAAVKTAGARASALSRASS